MQNAPNREEIDRLQRKIAGMIATNPVGVNLLLIGGFRYRLLDDSPRFSVDIDYHWDGDLEIKQQELLRFFQRTVLRQIRKEVAYEGRAAIKTGPDADSPTAKFLELHFWKKQVGFDLPIEITRILRLDPTIIKTSEGVVHPTISETDLIESKIIAILNRVYIQHRDLVDLFLYSDRLHPSASERLHKKFKQMALKKAVISARIRDFEKYPEYHIKALQQVIEDQMTTVMAQQINAGGGGRAVLNSVLEILHKTLRL